MSTRPGGGDDEGPGDTRSGTSPLAWAGAVLIVLGLVGIALALALPLEVGVTVSADSSISNPGDYVVDVECGSPLRGGPETVSSGGWFESDPCQGAIGGRRIAAAIAGVALLVGLALRRAERQTSPSSESVS